MGKLKLPLPKYKDNGIMKQKVTKMRNINSKKRHRNPQGFMLVELLIAIVILVVVLVGYLQLFIYCLGLAETSSNITLAIAEAQDKMEEMRNHGFDTLTIDYGAAGIPGNTFNLSQLDGTGTIYFIPSAITDLKHIQIVISWVDRKNRVIGGTDENGDGRLDSPVKLESVIVKR